VQNKHWEVVRLLLERNDVEPNVKDALGGTPLLLAVHAGHMGVGAAASGTSRG
jgi:ankyrin repeat protein